MVKYMKIKNGPRKKINEILNTLIDAKREDLNNILTDMSELFNEETINKIKRVLTNTHYTKLDYRKKIDELFETYTI